MKTNKLLMGAALLTAGLTACNSDAPFADNTPQTVDTDQTRFISVQITTPRQQTKAFEDGTAAESNVNRLDFIFYDVNGNPTGTPMTFSGSALTPEVGGFTEGPFENGNVTRIWTSVVPVYLTQGQNLPSYVMCLVNATDAEVSQVNSDNMAALRELETPRFSNNGNFVMTNSVYYGTNELTGETEQRMSATPLNPVTQLFTTAKEAEDAITNSTEGALLNIYVERAAAKVGLTLGADAVQDYTLTNGAGEGEVTLTFVPEYWFMNAIDNSLFITKRYGLDKDGVINYYPEYSEINDTFADSGMANTWNDPTNHRSYWGCSPGYYISEYPLVSDDVNDLVDYSHDYSSKYYSYTEVVDLAKTTGVTRQALAATDGTFTANTSAGAGVIYTRETTTASADIRNVNANPAATVASAVVVGKYQVNGEFITNTAFYVDPNAGTNGTFYPNSTSAKQALIARQHVIFGDDQGNDPYNVEDIYEIRHPYKVVRENLANPNIAGQLVALQLPAVPEGRPLYYYDGKEFVRITEANRADVNVQLIQAGYMNCYASGLAFFNIPIRHLGFDIDNVDGKLYADGKYNWGAMKIGDLGLVRNHVYSITVSQIAGIGTGLRNPDQPIVPSKDEVNQYIAMRLNILAWNVVNSWSVSF